MAFAAPIMAGVGMVSSLAGGIVGAQGAEQTAAATAANDQYQAGVAAMNAKVAAQEADLASASGEVEAQTSGMKTAQLVGETKAAYGAGNVAGSTVKNVIGSEIKGGYQSQATARNVAAGKAFRLNVGASSDIAQVGALNAGATEAVAAGNIGAETSILGGVGGVSTKWAQASQEFGSPNPANWFSG